ncbi:MAG: T9SS C-terminal target domain-containing protein [Bacteroidetes bacterium]|nr:T9SS C-terminal target domain-containing protein [Bacteroidota bacterium]
MKKILLSLSALFCLLNANAQVIEKVNFVGALSPDASKDWTKSWTSWDPKNANYGAVSDSTTLNDASGEKAITTTVTLDASKVYLLKSIFVVKSGAKLVVPAGTVIRGRANTGASPKEYACIVVERGGQIDIQGTASKPVVMTSSKAVGSRDRGDWGGLLLAGKAVNNQGASTQMEGFNNVSFDNQLAFHGGTDDADNTGSLTYLRIEFAGFAFEPNKELNGLTFCSIGSKTKVDYVQVSFSGDDSYEWFGGTVNAKHLIAYKGTDDDFDTDFGYRGTVQFGIGQRDSSYYDLSWTAASGASTSECFESDNDASGSGKLPLTAAVFTNMTCVGPVPLGGSWSTMGTTSKGAFRRGARIRRNSRLSITNSIFMGYRNFIMFDGDSTLYAAGVKPVVKVSDVNDLIRNNYFCNTSAAATKSTTNTGLVEISAGSVVDSLDKWVRSTVNNNMIDKAAFTAGTVLVDPQNKTNPDFRPVSSNKDLVGTSDYDLGIYKKYGTFVVCDSITRQPKSISVKTGSNALFVFNYTDGNAVLQWQNNKGTGYKNLSNVGQYAGFNNDSLSVSTVTMMNNGEKFRCMISTRWCKDSTSVATLTAIFKACSLISTQPTSLSKASGADANFSVATSDTSAKVFWQSDLDLGMTSIPAGSAKYTGVNSKSLTVKAVSIRNHTQPFRAIAYTNLCADTSSVAKLSITDSCINFKSVKVTDTLLIKVALKVGNLTKNNNIKVYPVPTQNKFTIDNGDYASMGGYQIKIYNTASQLVFSQVINQKVYTVDLANWTGVGIYQMQVINGSGVTVATKSIILQ